jgi:transposase
MQQHLLLSEIQSNRRPRKARGNGINRRDRLFRVQIGVAAGKSNRQIAKQLGVDEGTVRRDRLTLLLSKEEVRAVKAGAAVEPLLRSQERRKAETIREKQEEAERNSQFLTNRLAMLITEWLTQFSMIDADKLHVIRGVDRLSWEFQTPKHICILIQRSRRQLNV